ncbi:hypothetical protein N9Y41_00945 [Planktomarina temperata]|nr:hypothetical protein [Planktomarina temperata]
MTSVQGNSTITSGAGADTITAGTGADTIDAGAGNDHINVSAGADTITGGTGNDTYDTDSNVTAAVAQTTTALDINTTVTLTTNDKIILTLNGDTYEETYATGATNTIAAFVASHKDAILAEHGVTITAIDTNTDFKLVGKADGTTFTATWQIFDSGVGLVAQAATTTGGTAKHDVLSDITDFAAGDILDLAGALTETTITYYEGAGASHSAAATVMVLTDAAGFADAEAAEDEIVTTSASADGILVFINSALGHAQVVIDDDVSVDAFNLGSSTGDQVIFNLTGITNSVDLAAAFSADSFIL